MSITPAIKISPPSSKSIAHRALICASFSKDKSTISNITMSSDILATINSLKALGVSIHINESTVIISGGDFHNAVLDCNESGSTLRFLIPIIAALGIGSVFTGKKSLLSRPLSPLADLLFQNNVSFIMEKDRITINGKLISGKYFISGDVSSQYITGLLLALSLINKKSEIIVTSELQSKPYIDLTLMVMKSFGITVQNENYSRFIILGKEYYKACDFDVETDYSGAAFFLVASKIYKPITVTGLNKNSLQGDIAIINILKNKTPFEIDGSNIPDLVPIIAVYMCFLHGKSKITNLARLRFKESDRLSTTTSELKNLGADITISHDTLIINGMGCLQGGHCNSHNDHRIAMSVAIASLICKDAVYLDNKDCVNKSYPTFWEDFNNLGKEVFLDE